LIHFYKSFRNMSAQHNTKRKAPPIETDSWCYTEIAPDKEFTYSWTIEQFMKIAKAYPHSKTMYSEQFVIPLKNRNTIWRLKIYPNGRTEADQNNLTVFLKDSGRQTPSNVKAHVEFSIINDQGNRAKTKPIDKEYKVLHHAFGFSNFVKHADLEADPSLLPNGNLTIHVKITIHLIVSTNFTSTPPAPVKENDGVPSSLYTAHMKNMLASPKEFMSDITLRCRDGLVDCHCSILSARSPVFKAMFAHPTNEKETGTVDLLDVDACVCRSMVEFMYTGLINKDEVSLDLLVVADKYHLQDLKSLCEVNLSDALSLDNALDVLIVATRHSAGTLKGNAKTFLLNDTTDLLKIPDWKATLEPYPALLSEILESVINKAPANHKRKRIEESRLISTRR